MAPKHLKGNPAAGSYTIPSKLVEGPKAGMHALCNSIDMNKKNNFPGAGTYELQNIGNKNMKNSPQFSMGKETRDRNPHFKEQKQKPGAGTYDGTHDLKKKAPSFGFGTS